MIELLFKLALVMTLSENKWKTIQRVIKANLKQFHIIIDNL